MSDPMDEYARTDDLSEKYRLLREEAARLRGQRDRIERFEDDEVEETLRGLDERLEGHLIAFVANDFGYPAAFRPEGIDRGIQNEVREAILRNKYDDSNDDLAEIRRRLLEAHPAIHKAILVEYRDGTLRYHLPEGSNPTTNFLTVREMVGLVDYTTNSAQCDGLSRTY
jgi:hypothetical protein